MVVIVFSVFMVTLIQLHVIERGKRIQFVFLFAQQPPFRPTNIEEARYELVKPKEEDALINYPEPYQDPIMVCTVRSMFALTVIAHHLGHSIVTKLSLSEYI
jgi:hypothetical protein